MRVKLQYLVCDNDRHGNTRYYVRAPGQKKIRIKAAPLTEPFMEEYRAAISGVSKPVPGAIRPGSFRELCVKYFASDKFKALDVSTRSWQRRSLDSICQKYGACPIKLMEGHHVRKIRNERQDHPASANMRMKAMRAMFGWANEEEEIKVDPTVGVKRIKYTSHGHHSWTDDDIAQYQERHPVGTKARLALDLLRFTAGRREDIPRLGRQNLYGAGDEMRIKFIQAKNEHRAPVEVDIPLHRNLARSVALTETGVDTFLINELGRPFTTNGFGNKFKNWCREAGLAHCSAHGVRKATATALANNDATPHQIMAVTGHQSLKEVERYTKAADRKKNATHGMAKLK
jgi:integrase/recombinase XerD